MKKVKRNGLFVAVPKTETYYLPEGKFKCRVDNVFELQPHKVKNGKEIRCVFEVEVPGMENRRCLAGREFVPELDPTGELRSFFSRVVPSGFFAQHEGNEFHLKELIGLEGIIELRHYDDGEHENPYVFVWDLQPLPRTDIKLAA